MPEKTFNRDGWGLILIIAVGLALGLGLLAFIWLFARVLALLALAVALAAALSPLVAFLERRLPRAAAVILIYLVIVLAFVGIGWIVFPPLATQAQEIGASAPELIREAQTWLGSLDRLSNINLVDTLLPQLGRLTGAVVALPGGILSSLLEIVVVLFLSIYLLVEAPALRNFYLSLFPASSRERAETIAEDMAQAMGGYIRGTVLAAILVGILTYFGLLLIGVDFALVLALLAGVFELIPYLGPILAAIPILTIALLESPGQALVALIFIVVLQQVESYILVPNIMRTQTKVSPLLVLLAVIAGGRLGGLLGAIIAIPLAAALRVFVREIVAPAVRRHTGAEKMVET